MELLSSMAMYPRLWLTGAVVLLMVVVAVNLRWPLRVILAVLVLLPAAPLLLLRLCGLAVVDLADVLLRAGPWHRPLAWAAREVELYTNTQED